MSLGVRLLLGVALITAVATAGTLIVSGMLDLPSVVRGTLKGDPLRLGGGADPAPPPKADLDAVAAYRKAHDRYEDLCVNDRIYSDQRCGDLLDEVRETYGRIRRHL